MEHYPSHINPDEAGLKNIERLYKEGIITKGEMQQLYLRFETSTDGGLNEDYFRDLDRYEKGIEDAISSYADSVLALLMIHYPALGKNLERQNWEGN